MAEPTPDPLPIFPPLSFVQRYNEAHPDKVRTALDPMVLLAWHMATEDLRRPGRFLSITGF